MTGNIDRNRLTDLTKDNEKKVSFYEVFQESSNGILAHINLWQSSNKPASSIDHTQTTAKTPEKKQEPRYPTPRKTRPLLFDYERG